MSCAGMLGKQCSCGKWHETVDNGLPIQMYEGTLDERPSMFASRWFWISAVACGLFYVGAWCALS